MLFHHHSPDCPECRQTTQPPSSQKTQTLWLTLGLIAGFAVLELGVGLYSHSLALLADAEHMISDGLSLGIALLATWIAQFPVSDRATFGYRRVEILAALINSLGLMAIALWIAWESALHLLHPPEEILSIPMLLTATLGLGVSSLNAALLHHHSHHDLNVKGAFLHMVADALSSIGVILAALIVWVFHWNWVDSAVSLLVSLLILASALPLLSQSLNILLEKTPPHLCLGDLKTHLESFEGIIAAEQVRAWGIALDYTALSAHLTTTVQEGKERDRLLRTLETSLKETFGIQEIFLQLTAPPLEPLMSLSIPGSILNTLTE